MSWRFRQSFKVLPGLKLNLSKTGLSASIGGAPFTLNLGTRGAFATASIPGTGISFRQHLSADSNPSATSGGYQRPRLSTPNDLPAPLTDFLPASDWSSIQLQEIRSGSTELLTSQNLKELKQLIQAAYDEHEAISAELSRAKQEETRTTERFNSWDRGFLLKKLLKKRFEVRKVEAEISSARACELEEQLQLTKIATQVELAREQAEPYFRMRDGFAALAECRAIWDVSAERATDKFRERTIANKSISRKRVGFALGGCDLFQWEQQVPHLQNANGGDMFLYPGFILYRASRTAFSFIDYHDVKPATALVRFHEEDGVPGDSKVVGQTWAKTNKDGTRDKRFAENYEIPVALYGELTLKSETGLWEEYQFSNPECLDRFVKCWNVFVASFDRQISVVVASDDTPTAEGESKPATLPKPVGTDVHFECSKCRQPIEVNSEAAGQEFRCPGCGEKLVVPEISI